MCPAARHPAHRDKHSARNKQRKEQEPGCCEARIARLQPSIRQWDEREVAAGRRRLLRLPHPGHPHARLRPRLGSAVIHRGGQAQAAWNVAWRAPAKSGSGGGGGREAGPVQAPRQLRSSVLHLTDPTGRAAAAMPLAGEERSSVGRRRATAGRPAATCSCCPSPALWGCERGLRGCRPSEGFAGPPPSC